MISAALLAYAVLQFRSQLDQLPNRTEFGEREVALHFQPARVGQGSDSPFQVVGAWRLFVDDTRFGGLSALALSDGEFIGVTDSGVVVRFPRPGRSGAKATLRELPGGPGSANFKVNRDSEALVADPDDRGWWVAFEIRDEVWLYDPSFDHALEVAPIRNAGLARNRGIEGMVADEQGLLLFLESGRKALRLGRSSSIVIQGISGWLSDAVKLPDGTLAVINRRPTPIGLSNTLVVLAMRGSAYHPLQSWRIPVGRLDNVEGVAAEPIPGGGTRLWMVTDNNFQQRRPTMLIAAEFRPPPSRR